MKAKRSAHRIKPLSWDYNNHRHGVRILLTIFRPFTRRRFVNCPAKDRQNSLVNLIAFISGQHETFIISHNHHILLLLVPGETMIWTIHAVASAWLVHCPA